jgi:RimJ/RimL family protein N-acetyltransferase
MHAEFDVTLRPYTLNDCTDVYEAVRESLAELIPWMPWCHPEYSIDETQTWLETQVDAFHQGSEFEFAMVSKTGRYLGGCGLNRIDRINRVANLGYWVRSGATGRGVATAAVRQLYGWGLRHTDLVRFEILIAVENRASRRVAEKAGAHPEGILRNRVLLQGMPHDAAVYSLIR